MRISRLQAEKVHGYLPIDVSFFEDLTFLIGLNGSGKTSALKLLMALVAPNIYELATIVFDSVILTIVIDNEEVNGDKKSEKITISAVKTETLLILSISNIDNKLEINRTDLDYLVDLKRREDSRAAYPEKFLQHPVIQQINKISTPMFLGLDRRFYAPGLRNEDMSEIQRREFLGRRYWPEEAATTKNADFAALLEVNYLVVSITQDIRTSQEKLDEQLRIEFFKKAFEYKPAALRSKMNSLPSSEELEKYKAQLKKIEHSANEVALPVPEIKDALASFLERMTKVVGDLNKSRAPRNGPQKNNLKKSGNKSINDNNDGDVIGNLALIEWLINKPQADRISENLHLLDKYIENRTALRNPINRFILLVNDFLTQTKKTVSVSNKGQLLVEVENNPEIRAINALSSGERQLLVMLANLSLNPNLAGSGVFIVDEPELSLHIDWQEKFVDAIREANPSVQVILATHSPAIVLDRTSSCCSMNGASNA